MKLFNLMLFVFLLSFYMHSQTDESNIDLQDSVTASSVSKENPFLETLDTWSLASSDKEKVKRILKEKEEYEKQMFYNDVEEVLYVVIPIIFVLVGIVFVRKILK